MRLCGVVTAKDTQLSFYTPVSASRFSRNIIFEKLGQRLPDESVAAGMQTGWGRVGDLSLVPETLQRSFTSAPKR